MSLSIAVTIFSLFYWLENEPVLGSFGLGVMACTSGLSKFHALPYMLGRTIPRAKLRFRDRPFHHSFLGTMLFIVVVILDFLFSIQNPFTFMASFLYGGVIFAVISQVPEILEHRTLGGKSVT